MDQGLGSGILYRYLDNSWETPSFSSTSNCHFENSSKHIFQGRITLNITQTESIEYSSIILDSCTAPQASA